MKVLYLDFDNVLHGDVLRFRKPPSLRPATPGQVLFESVPVLVRLLEPYPDLKIVLSTSWVRELGFTRARGFLPENIQKRVIGATYHKRHMRKDEFAQLSRYSQIIADVERRALTPTSWLSIDDDVEGWQEHARMNLVQMPSVAGLGDPAAARELERRLERMFGSAERGDDRPRLTGEQLAEQELLEKVRARLASNSALIDVNIDEV